MLNDIDKRILGYLGKQDWPVTTDMVAKQTKLSWNTAQIHLYKLVAEGMLRSRKVGRQNQWAIKEKWKEDAPK